MIRPATENDRRAILDLGVAEETAWFGRADNTAEEIGEWIEEEGGLGAGVVALDAVGSVGGFAAPGRHQAVFVADPLRTDRAADELLPWLAEHCDEVMLMTFAGDTARVAAFERHGLRHRRSSFDLVRAERQGPLPGAAFPAGIEVARYRFGDEDASVHRLVYVDARWGSIPGHGERDLDGWRKMVNRCRSMFIARRNGRPVGWVGGRMLDSGRGHVTMLAVAESERRRGLGRALLLHAFADLQRSGGRDLSLGVQAENGAALGLYRSIGFEVEREWRVYGA